MRIAMIALVCAGIGGALAQSSGGTRPGTDPKPSFPPSYDVHISPTTMTEPGTSTTHRPDYWVARGFDLKEMLIDVYRADPYKAEFPASLDHGQRYDFAMVLPAQESQDAIDGFVKKAIQTEFHLQVTHEVRAADVYVLTIPNGLGPAVKTRPIPTSGVWGSGMGISTGKTVSISGQGIRMEELVRTLEQTLRRPILDETDIRDGLDFDVSGDGSGKDGLIALLREKLGIVLTADHRSVDMLVVREQRQ